ncbi:MAG: prolyl oligopeptidase family serine peptidase [Alphaproteobacteria bacterium]
MRKIAFLAVAMSLLSACVAMTDANGDPNAWLEDTHGEKALSWVRAENERTLARLTGDKRHDTFRREALAIFTAKDRIAMPSFRAGGVDNLWQDARNPQGLWRHASLASYRSGRPKWTTLLDLDALSKAEGKKWFLKGIECLAPDDRYCLVNLSDGGGDAIEIREFDAKARQFVSGGFAVSRAKQSIDWVDRDTVLLARAFDASEETTSGYAAVVREVKRGQKPQEGRIVFRAAREDTMVSARVLRNADGAVEGLVAERRVGFFDVELYLIDGPKPVRLALPTYASLRGYVRGQMIFTVQDKWKDFGQGALVAIDLARVRKSPAAPEAAAELVMQPTPMQTIDGVQTTRDAVVVQLLDTVKGAVEVRTRGKAGWAGRRLALPADSALVVRAAQQSGSLVFVSSESFLAPTRLWSADVSGGTPRMVAALPARFRPGTHRVEQNWAVSKDGTRIPYFLVVPKKARMDGSTPTLLFGYGGFQISKPPAYLPEMGKLWLERGGAYVIANIRGGGEFGPAWHKSALRENRQRAFDDFAAVAEDLIARKVTSPRRLGIYGRSNGGVLTTVSMTQRPDLFNAVVVESPLIDMLRYHKLSAGASWVAEYGNPDVAADRSFIAAYSAYQKLVPGKTYPEPYVTTNTEDDRVHPGHARKYAARLAQMGAPYLYFENTIGGHSNDADPALNAERWARHYVYLAQKLMD